MADASKLTPGQHRVIRAHVATELAGEAPAPEHLEAAERLMEAGMIDLDELLPRYRALGDLE